MRKLQIRDAASPPRKTRDGRAEPAADFVWVAVVAMLAVVLTGLFGEAHAQNGPVPPSGQNSEDVRNRAPIGARQPRPRDLPENVLRDEGRVTPSQRDFDKSLQICRDC